MEDVRYAASFAAGPSNKDKIKELGDKLQNLRHVKEKSEAAQELVQKIEGGLAHIGELLGETLIEAFMMKMKDIMFYTRRRCFMDYRHSCMIIFDNLIVI